MIFLLQLVKLASEKYLMFTRSKFNNSGLEQIVWANFVGENSWQMILVFVLLGFLIFKQAFAKFPRSYSFLKSKYGLIDESNISWSYENIFLHICFVECITVHM